jgi:hypothetical protein
MARSYFSRIATPPPAATLMPPRPITTLWKAARLERIFGESAMPMRDSARSLIDLGGVAKASLAKTMANSEPHGDGAPGGNHELQRGLLPKQAAKAGMNSFTPPMGRTAVNSRKLDEGKRRGLTRASSRNIEAGGPKQLSNPGDASLLTDVAIGSHGDAEYLHPVGAPGAMLDRRAPPTGGGRAESAQGETKKSLHIGKIEVQVVPPRAAARQSSSSKPRSRLARGYTLWTNRQHQ